MERFTHDKAGYTQSFKFTASYTVCHEFNKLKVKEFQRHEFGWLGLVAQVL